MPVFCTACRTERTPGDEFDTAQRAATDLDPIARALRRAAAPERTTDH